MAKTPMIGIPSAEHDVGKAVPQFLSPAHYIEQVAKAGGIPVQLPILAGTADEVLQEMVDRCDGFLLPGGPDFDSEWYQEPLLSNLEHSSDEISFGVQETALRFIRLAVASGKPVLGICLGLQVLNVALGGSLYQDIPTQIPSAVKHSFPITTPESRWVIAHTVIAKEGSLIHQLSGLEISVNSFHHQAIKRLAPGLHITATAPDGVPEAIEHDSFPLLAVQWHPENLAHAGIPEAQAIFQWLIAAAK